MIVMTGYKVHGERNRSALLTDMERVGSQRREFSLHTIAPFNLSEYLILFVYLVYRVDVLYIYI